MFLAITVLSVVVPGVQLSGLTNSSVYVVPYGFVLKILSNILLFEKYAIVIPTTPSNNTDIIINVFLFFSFFLLPLYFI